jgi:hypothetical protein
MRSTQINEMARIVVEQGHDAEYNDDFLNSALVALYPAEQHNEVRRELESFSYVVETFGKKSSRFFVAILLLFEGDLARLRDFPKPQDYPEIHGLLVTVRTIFLG